MNPYEQDALAARRKREQLAKASNDLGHSNLLGVLTALSAVDALAKRDVSTSLEAMRERAQSPKRGAQEHNRTFAKLYPDLVRAADDGSGAARQGAMLAEAKQDDRRSGADHRQADADAAAGRSRRVLASAFADSAEWHSSAQREAGAAAKEGQQVGDAEGRLRSGDPRAKDLWGAGSISDAMDVLSAEDMAALAARRWRGRFF